MQDLDKDFFCYKEKPLVRKGNTIYYGSMLDDYVVMMQIRDTKNVDGKEVSNNITVQLMRTATDIKPQDIVVKKSDKTGLASALEIAEIWLNRVLAETKQ